MITAAVVVVVVVLVVVVVVVVVPVVIRVIRVTISPSDTHTRSLQSSLCAPLRSTPRRHSVTTAYGRLGVPSLIDRTSVGGWVGGYCERQIDFRR